METKKAIFSDNVIIIDTFFLNRLIADMRNHFGKKLNREIEVVDIPCMLDFMALDMGIKIEADCKNKILIIWITDSDSQKLVFSNLCDINKELNAKAFDDKVGSFEMIAAPCKDMATREDLMLNLIELIANSAEVKRIGILPECMEYDEEAFKALEKISDKETHLFVLDGDKFQPEHTHIQSALFPTLAGMNIKGDELQ